MWVETLKGRALRGRILVTKFSSPKHHFRGLQRACGALQFPFQRVCESCFAKDDFDAVRLSDRRGRVVTYTLDYFFPTPNPPTIVTVTDIDGARVHLQLVDCAAEDVRPGLEVEFVFRRIHEGGGRPNYYWKGRPVAVTGGSGDRT